VHQRGLSKFKRLCSLFFTLN